LRTAINDNNVTFNEWKGIYKYEEPDIAQCGDKGFGFTGSLPVIKRSAILTESYPLNSD
jgi:hypothetical protein